MISSLLQRLSRARSPAFNVDDPRYYRDLEGQRKEYLKEREEFKHMTRRLRIDRARAVDISYDPLVFTRKYWEKLRKRPVFLNTADQAFWTDFEAFLQEFGLCPSKKHKLVRLPYLKHWTKHTTYWEM